MDIKEIFDGILKGNRRYLAKGITLIESRRVEDVGRAESLINMIIPYTGKSLRIGVTGVPGVGKSTFIEYFGKYLIAKGNKVAVLAVDPSSVINGGSILGDKTRMEELSKENNAFIRPSPSGDSLGGVARKTREAMLLCEAAGFDVVIIETVGVGQSEVAVSTMVDIFTLLQLPNAGDELQGIKKGIMEIADIILITKSEGENRMKSELAKSQIEFALHIVKKHNPLWECKVINISSITGDGIDEYYKYLNMFVEKMKLNGDFEHKRSEQALSWMWTFLMDSVKETFHRNPKISSVIKEMEYMVKASKITPTSAAGRILNTIFNI